MQRWSHVQQRQCVFEPYQHHMCALCVVVDVIIVLYMRGNAGQPSTSNYNNDHRASFCRRRRRRRHRAKHGEIVQRMLHSVKFCENQSIDSDSRCVRNGIPTWYAYSIAEKPVNRIWFLFQSPVEFLLFFFFRWWMREASVSVHFSACRFHSCVRGRQSIPWFIDVHFFVLVV